MNGFLAAFPPVIVSCALSAPLIRLKDELIPDRLFGSEIKSRSGTSEGEAVRASAEEYKKRVKDFSGSLITSAAVMNGIASKLRKVRPDTTWLRERSRATADCAKIGINARIKFRHLSRI